MGTYAGRYSYQSTRIDAVLAIFPYVFLLALRLTAKMKPAGLYIHIPFCTHKCSYCDFYSQSRQSIFVPYQNNPLFINRLLQDMRFFKERYGIAVWKTIYIGGGTPSLLSTDDVFFLISSICGEQEIPPEECTIEANPEDVHPEWLSACRAGGIDRLSLGVQSFDDTVLSANGRRGSGKKTATALDTVRKYWTGSLSCDLIAGLSSQTAESFYSDLQRLVDYRIEHLSVYGLCSEKTLPDMQEDAIGERLRTASAFLIENNYVQYEVSNFSYKNQYKSLHNQIYWQLEPYAGIGPAACGTLVYENKDGMFLSAERFTGIRDILLWQTALNPNKAYDYETVNRKDFIIEALMMGFRLSEGISQQRFRKRFGRGISDYIGDTLAAWEKKSCCCITPDSVYLTAEGLFFLNRFLLDALMELDKTLH